MKKRINLLLYLFANFCAVTSIVVGLCSIAMNVVNRGITPLSLGLAISAALMGSVAVILDGELDK
jgi:hypothetical protein